MDAASVRPHDVPLLYPSLEKRRELIGYSRGWSDMSEDMVLPDERSSPLLLKLDRAGGRVV